MERRNDESGTHGGGGPLARGGSSERLAASGSCMAAIFGRSEGTAGGNDVKSIVYKTVRNQSVIANR